MAELFTPRAKLGYPDIGDVSWGVTLNADTIVAGLDPNLPLTGLLATFHEGRVSSTLGVDVASGTFVTQDGVIHTYAGVTSYLITSSSTRVLYLDGAASWALAQAAAYPATPHIRIATVVAGGSTLTSVTDNRSTPSPSGSWAEAMVINVGTATGLQLGGGSSQKLGFLGATPVVQQAANADALAVLATFGLKAAEGTPTATVAAGAGSGATSTVTGTDRRGIIFVTTGTGPATGTQATINFSATLASMPKSITITPLNGASAAAAATVFLNASNWTTAHFTLDIATTALTASTPYQWSYRVD